MRAGILVSSIVAVLLGTAAVAGAVGGHQLKLLSDGRKSFNAVVRTEGDGATMNGLALAADLGVPIVDACLSGRARPEVQQQIPYLVGIPAALHTRASGEIVPSGPSVNIGIPCRMDSAHVRQASRALSPAATLVEPFQKRHGHFIACAELAHHRKAVCVIDRKPAFRDQLEVLR